jgi:hypothetical protein
MTWLASLQEAAIDWAAGGPAQPLVDVAVDGLVGGVDTPTLRLLAGSTRAEADEEAVELAPKLFEEFGIQVHERLSTPAIIEAARMEARRFLASGDSGHDFARRMYAHCVRADYPPELFSWPGFEDYYDMINTGVITGSLAELDADVRAAARTLADG